MGAAVARDAESRAGRPHHRRSDWLQPHRHPRRTQAVAPQGDPEAHGAAALPARPSSHALPARPSSHHLLALSLFPALGLAAQSPASGSRLTSCLCAVGQWQGVPLGSMLFFDDNLADVRAAARDGVTSVHCIAADRRRQRCVSPRHPAPSPPARRQPPPQSCAIARPHHPPGAGSLTPLFNKGCETTHSSPRRLRQRRSRSHVARRFARAEPRAGPAGVPAIASLLLA